MIVWKLIGLGIFFSDSKSDDKTRPQPCTNRWTETEKVKQEIVQWNVECIVVMI